MSRQRLAINAIGASAMLLVSLVTFEGYREAAYIPVEGDVATIGFGTTAGVQIGDRIDPITALTRALIDVQKFEGAIKQCVKVDLYQHEYDAFVSLAYNIGPGKEGVVDGFCWLRAGGPSTLVRKLNAYDYPGACDAILMWDKYRGKPLRGLTIRRQQEHRLCRGE